MPIDLSPFVGFFVATTIGLALSLATFVVARKSGLTPLQDELIDTLKDNAAALGTRVKQLEDEVDRLNRQRVELSETVAKLREAVGDLAAENAELRRQLKMLPRTEGKP